MRKETIRIERDELLKIDRKARRDMFIKEQTKSIKPKRTTTDKHSNKNLKPSTNEKLPRNDYVD
jgi:hypothetical protein